MLLRLLFFQCKLTLKLSVKCCNISGKMESLPRPVLRLIRPTLIKNRLLCLRELKPELNGIHCSQLTINENKTITLIITFLFPGPFLFQSCLSFMDRGFVFCQVKKYLDKFKVCDPKALFDFKFTFLQTICLHEHFVPFNLPLQANKLAKDCDEGKNDFFILWNGLLTSTFWNTICVYIADPAKLKLSEDFINRHFLAGILLKQVSVYLNSTHLHLRNNLIFI